MNILRINSRKKTIMISNHSLIRRSLLLKTDDLRIDIMHLDGKWTAIIINK